MKTYTFRQGSRLKADPQIIGEHLETLREHHGGALPTEAVVEDAQHDNSPLHALFEWDDTEAARQHRLSQARTIIGAVVVKFEEAPEAQPIRAFVNVRQDDRKQVYTSVSAALEDPVLRAQVLNDALKELRRLQQKYADLEELAGVFGAIDQTSDDLAA
jgi:hypothetical protein